MSSAPTFNIGDRVQERRKAPSIQNNRDLRRNRRSERSVFVRGRKGTIMNQHVEVDRAGRSYWHYEVQYDGTARTEKRTQGVLKLLEEE